MSLSAKSLNGDSTFLLTFTSAEHTYTVLIDPWLAGASTIWNSRFAITHHTCEPAISSLAELPTPDLILISQDKTDHCHEETLKTLPADSAVHILATPAAARKIRSWRYFTRATITAMPVYSPKNPKTVLRFPIQPSRTGGEVTVTFIPQKLDVTSLHNAIGITFSPTSSKHASEYEDPTCQLPPSPPMTPVDSRSPSHVTTPDTPLFPLPSSLTSTTRPLSVLYAPHSIGIPCITPFMANHLAPMSALPLTMLFHCITIERNPWFLGGAVCPGLPAGTNLVRHFGARYWLSAHDEPKDSKGWATSVITSQRYTLDEAQTLLDSHLERERSLHPSRETGETRIVGLNVGEELSVRG